MKRILKIELERAYRSRTMTAALGIGYLIAIIQFIKVVFPRTQSVLGYFDGTVITYPYSVFNAWLGMDDVNPWLSIYLMIFPILAALPYGASWFEDWKSGYVKNICLKVKRWKYMLAKYIAVFLSGGTTVVLPLLLNLLLTASVLPSLLPSMNGLFGVGGVGMFAGIFYTHPYVYTFIYLIMYFIYGGVFSTIALAAANFIKYKFIVVLAPFMVYFLLGILGDILKLPYIMEIGTRRLLAMTQYRSVSEFAFFGEALLIGAAALAVYFMGRTEDDIL